MKPDISPATNTGHFNLLTTDSGDAGGSYPTAANIQGDLLSNGNCFGLGEGHGDIRSPHHPGPSGRHTHAYGGLTTLDCGSTLKLIAELPKGGAFSIPSKDFGEVEGQDPVSYLLAHNKVLGLWVQRDPPGHLQDALANSPAGRHITIVIDVEYRHLAYVVQLL